MKNLLSVLFLSTSVIPFSSLLNNNINNQFNVNSSFNILVEKTYPEETLTIGFEDVTVANNNTYAAINNNNTIEIYQIINKKAQLLTTFKSSKWLQLNSLKSYVLNNKIYYEALIKTDQYNVSSGQYFIFDINTKTVTDLGSYRLAPDTSRYTYNNNLNNAYHYQNYLIFVHNSLWYVNSSTTIINLTNNKVTTINSNNGIYMAFDNGLLYYYDNSGKLTITNIMNNKSYHLEDTLNQKLYQVYAGANQGFVTGADNKTNEYFLNQIKIENDQLVLVKLSTINEGGINQVYSSNNILYFAGESYDHIKDINSVYLYQWNQNKLETLTKYDIKHGLDASLFYTFDNGYFDISYSNTELISHNIKTIRYDLNNKKTFTETIKNYEISQVVFLKNQTLFCLSEYNKNILNTYIGQIQW